MICNKNKYIYDVKLERNIAFICENEYSYFLNKENVVGVGCGYKVKDGFRTSILCIQIFVTKKISEFLLSKNQVIPKCYKGIQTDVIETGEISACSLTNKVRPVQGGYGISVSHFANYGTLGCLVTNGVRNFLLTTNHVITQEGHFPIGTPITQPPYYYGGKDPEDTIGTINKFIPLRPIDGGSQPINLTDCAIGLLTKPDILTPEIALIGRLKGVKRPKLNEQVKKVGCMSELTIGHVTSIHVVSTIRFFSFERYLFKDLIFTTAMLSNGDSGSILVNKYYYGLGLGFAGGEGNAAYCPLDTVLDQLDVHLVT